MANKYDDTKVKNIGIIDGPNDGMALVVEFEKTVEIDGKYFAFPLNIEQWISIFKVLTGKMSNFAVEKLESPIIKPQPMHAYRKLSRD